MPSAAIRRGAVVQSLVCCDHLAITSRLDRSERVYRIRLSDAYDTMLSPLDGDATATSVGTRALIEAIDIGQARPCSALPERQGVRRR